MSFPLFLNDPEVRVPVGTDAAGEGVNLQKAPADGRRFAPTARIVRRSAAEARVERGMAGGRTLGNRLARAWS